MNLQEFIEQTLLQVAKASKNVSEQMQRDGLGKGVRDSSSINVSFDIAVTVSQGKNKNANASLKVLNAVVLGTDREEVIKSENVSRIKLELPLRIVGGKI
jgi:hypothetical protein